MDWKETDDIWRLYRREWVIVHSITRHGDDDGRPVFEQAHAWIEDNLKDRVHEKDVNVTLNTDLQNTFWVTIEVFKENLKGEFKYVSLAQQYAAEQGYEEWVVVPRNSKSDHDIRSYGVVKL